ncbi:MAG: Mrp/NBP35 family ATP-binding protein [Gammaproteobacteria bacterium]|nr:Mrp/NBP35 family ATP-binding protein [Gammaproteobacteria bacterium]
MKSATTQAHDTGAGTLVAPAFTQSHALPGIRDVLLVASGKGGVGKSTIAVNLACAMARNGVRISLLDADLYGPSVARMLGTEHAAHDVEGRVKPASAHGVYALSVANLLPPEAALVWKGPLIAQSVTQLFHDVAWPASDVLIVDLPPGTGDVQLSILEQVPISGALVVTTPQQLAVDDAARAISLFHQRDVPVFGVVENMDCYVCPCCGERQSLFPAGAGRQLTARTCVPHLGGVALDPAAQACADAGMPLVVARPDSDAAKAFVRLASALANAIEQEQRARERSADENTERAHHAFWERLID